MTLYEIAQQYKDFFDFLEDNPDLPDETVKDTFEAIDGEFEIKADSIASYIKSLRLEAAAIKDEADALTQRAKAKTAKADRLLQMLLGYMQELNKNKIETARNVITLRNNPPAVEVYDMDALTLQRPDLLSAKPPEPNKKAIAALLKVGAEVPGCRQTTTQSLMIR